MGRKLLAGGVLAATIWAAVWLWTARRDDASVTASLQSVTDDYRRIIVLVDGNDTLDDATRARTIAAGRILFYRKQQALTDLAARLDRGRGVKQLIAYLSTPALHDADKLAFLDLVEALDTPKREHELKALRDNLQSIQLAYREEVSRIFAQFATRGGSATREKWDAYVTAIRKQFDRARVLADFGDVLPEEPAAPTRGQKSNEVFGDDFAPKTVALTFDDGPHPRYTEQVLALLRKYGIRATFFELGTNLGTVSDSGQVTLSRTAAVARKVLDAGHTLANHSFSHPVLPKLPEDQRAREIERTNALLTEIAGHKPELFRAPYGARNQQIIQQVTTDGLKSVMWNIDSLDWADPIPESIAMRVLHELAQKQKGIVLFHDIHKQSVLALSPVIEELMRQDYQFMTFDKGQLITSTKPIGEDRAAPASSVAPAPGETKRYYRESWALIVGINDYQHWPKLRYAVNDANAISEALVSKFNFKRENIRMLLNGDATRERILATLGDEFTDGKKIQRDDRVFVFFAGHGATRSFDENRQLGFIVPVDADPSNYYATAISMTSLREASDLIAAKHIYFVMDSCYSGLALTRAAGMFSKDRSYLDEISRRSSRQILTAGGADQQVADDGPGGHSVFTWTLLEGLQGKADLDGNGVITASELGAYVSPIVASFAKQTPAVGNLVGSEGGEFLFELQPQSLTATTPQLDAKAMQLTDQLSSLEKAIAAKQDELLKLQQSIQSLATAGKPPASKAPRAYDLDRQGQQLYREKKYPEALEKFAAAVQSKPKDPVLLNNLGFIYYALGRNDEAVATLQKTLQLDPNRKEAHENLADALMKQGKPEEAKPHYRIFLQLHPTSTRSEEIKRILQ
jgi:peptidoglycan/xylan/chitin deacetylase (PgdA/CDA1 family)/tetratricopeptide (TPR) repeat protein